MWIVYKLRHNKWRFLKHSEDSDVSIATSIIPWWLLRQALGLFPENCPTLPALWAFAHIYKCLQWSSPPPASGTILPNTAHKYPWAPTCPEASVCFLPPTLSSHLIFSPSWRFPLYCNSSWPHLFPRQTVQPLKTGPPCCFPPWVDCLWSSEWGLVPLAFEGLTSHWLSQVWCFQTHIQKVRALLGSGAGPLLQVVTSVVGEVSNLADSPWVWDQGPLRASWLRSHVCLMGSRVGSRRWTFCIPDQQGGGGSPAVCPITEGGLVLPAVVVQLLCHVQLLGTPWTAAYQASLSFTSRGPPSFPFNALPGMKWSDFCDWGGFLFYSFLLCFWCQLLLASLILGVRRWNSRAL